MQKTTWLSRLETVEKSSVRVYCFSTEHPFEEAAHHDRDRTFFDKTVKHFTQHGGLL